jgi:hypothetical protein
MELPDAVVELTNNNARRLTTLQRQGIMIQGLREGYWTRMLEYLCGEDLGEVRRLHELWVADEIDKAEQAVTRSKLLQGVQGVKP